ncbi:MAG: hypothetical protein IT307_01320, partial [Chloroflexi bacterium]|nr:hypothetical protein [Chloroflexota bacterium]
MSDSDRGLDPTTAAFVDEVVARLGARFAVGGVGLEGWRIELSDGWSLSTGAREGRMGGPYEPPTSARGLGGSVYLRWADGSISAGALTVPTLDEWEAQAAEWRRTAYVDAFAPEIP